MKNAITVLAILLCIGCSKRGAITGLSRSGKTLPDGREYRYFIGLNEDKEPRVLVIHYYATKGKERLILKPGVTYSSNDPLPDLKGHVAMITAWPANKKNSGLVVNGSKMDLSEGMNVAFVSNLSDPQIFVVSSDDVSGFMTALEESDWDEFFAERILPNLERWPQE